MVADELGRRRVDTAAGTKLGALLAAALGCIVTLYLFYPGFMPWDATFQFAQVISGHVENSHPPIMVYVWMLANTLVYGPGGMLILQVAAYWTGLALIATYATRSSWLQVMIVLGVGCFPPLFATIPVVLKDGGALAFLLLCSALALHARARCSKRLAWMALLCAFYASALRTPNLLAVLPLLWLLAEVILPGWKSVARRATVVVSIAVVFMAAIHQLDTRGVVRVPYRAAVPLWDIAMISLARDQFLIPSYAVNNPDLDMQRLRMISRDYRCDVHDPADLEQVTMDLSYRKMSQLEADQLLRDWVHTIFMYPREYLQHRWHVTKLLFTDPMLKLTFLDSVFLRKTAEPIPGFDPNIRFQARSGFNALIAALKWCSLTPLFSPWVYLGLAALVLPASFLARGDSAVSARTLAASGLLYVAPLPLIAPATDFRYSIWLVAASVIAAVLLAATCARRRDV